MEKKRWLAFVALTAVSFIYGANFSIAKIPMQHEVVQPLGFILIRIASGCLIFWIFRMLFVRENVERSDFIRLFLCGIFGVSLNMSFFFAGLKYTNPINGALVMTCTPIIVVILSRIMLKEQVTWQKVIGIALGLTGAILLIAKGFTGFTWVSIKGDLLVFLNATSFAMFLILVKRLSPKYHPLTIMSWTFTFGLLTLFPFAISSFMETEWGQMQNIDLASILYVIIFTTFLAYLMNTWAISQVKPSVVSSFIYLQPLFATLIAVILKMDQINVRMMVSGLLIFTGVYLIGKKIKRIPQTT